MLCFIDTESTGLDPKIHQPYEVAYWLQHEPEPFQLDLPHDLENADETALGIGNYWDRGFEPGRYRRDRWDNVEKLHHDLTGVTLVGCNPGFDAGMLAPLVGPVWKYRLVNVAEGAMWLFEWDEPRGLAEVAERLRELHFVIPEPDHTALGDVRTTRAVYFALRRVRAELG